MQGIGFWQEYAVASSTRQFATTNDSSRYLEHEKLKKFPRANIVLLRPSMCFMLLQTPDPLTLKSALPDFSKTTHIFLPVNDAQSVSVAESGSHWSLLLVSQLDGVAFHYDSLGGDNNHPAHNVSQKLSILLGKHLRFVAMRDSPQQENGSDCGVFVCMVMEKLLLSRLLLADSTDKVSMSLRNDRIDAKEGRKKMLRTIESFRKEGERRRSRSMSPYDTSRKDRSRSKDPPRIGEENEHL
jgi:sentrin-specific protease 8